MGGTSTTSQTQSSQLNPYNPANPGLQGILSGVNSMVPGAGINPTQTGAINTLESNASAGNTYAPAIGAGALGLLNGGGATNNDAAIKSNLGDYQGLLASTANGTTNGMSAIKPQLDQVATDVTNNVNGSWAAAGRDGSPGNAMALGRGIAAGEAPIIANQANTDTANRLAAAGSLYGAGNSTYGMLNADNATANSNIQAGAPMASTALAANDYAPNSILSAESQRFGIPASQYQTLLGMISPVAAQFGQNTGQSNGTSTMSGAQQFAALMGGAGSLMPKGSISFGAS